MRSRPPTCAPGRTRDVGDRPDPRPPPFPRGPRRRTVSPIDAGLRQPGGVTRRTVVRRRPDAHMKYAPPPDAPPPRGDVWRARQSHRDATEDPAAPGAPRRDAVRPPILAHERDGGHAPTRLAALARPTITPYPRRIGNRPRLQLLSRTGTRARKHRSRCGRTRSDLNEPRVVPVRRDHAATP